MKNVVNSVRFLGVDAINKAKSGHPGIVLGAAPMITELFLNHMKIDPTNPEWINRDRFVMAAGHGSALQYSVLHHAGYKVSLKDMKEFRQLNSKTPGHPEFGHTDGIDATSGPLGQGIAQAIGMAVSERYLSQRYNTKDAEIFNHYTYALCGDGDLQEGVTLEAMSLAGHLGLGKMIVLFDSNDIQLDGKVSMTSSEDLKAKCKAMKWHHILVEDGEKTSNIAKAIKAAKKELSRPTMIEIKTIIGVGTTKQGLSDTHGSPIGEEERKVACKNLGYDRKAFDTHPDAMAKFKSVKEKGNKEFKAWEKEFAKFEKAMPKEAHDIKRGIANDHKVELEMSMPFHAVGESIATRTTGGKCIEAISAMNKLFIGGSADLTKSTKAKGADGNFPEIVGGRNINFGVREFAMTAISNGISLHGVMKPFTGAFFVFSDYAKPAIRMAALQNIAPIYVYTHDSVAVGEDGPTHQPVEQLVGLRAIPNCNVVRPADANETIAAFQTAMKEKTRPTVMVLSRQNLEVVTRATSQDIEKGAYAVLHEEGKVKFTVIASGSEVPTAVKAVKELKLKGIRVVSMPSQANFDRLSKKEQEEIIKDRTQAVYIEAGSTMSGYKYANNVIGQDDFGLSAPGAIALAETGFDVPTIKAKIKKLYGGK